MSAELSYAAVVAHPDDDAYGMAGTVALHAEDPDFRFILIHATDGEIGDIRAFIKKSDRRPQDNRNGCGGTITTPRCRSTWGRT